MFTFITSGFEHSVANMTIYAVSLISSAVQGATLAGAMYNLVAVTIGNMIGGVLFMGTGVYILGSEKAKSNMKSKAI